MSNTESKEGGCAELYVDQPLLIKDPGSHEQDSCKKIGRQIQITAGVTVLESEKNDGAERNKNCPEIFPPHEFPSSFLQEMGERCFINEIHGRMPDL